MPIHDFVVAGFTLRQKDPRWDWGNPRSLLKDLQVDHLTAAAC